MAALDGRVAIVTGAGRGLGRAHALTLAAEGAAVVVNDLDVGVDGSAAGGSTARGSAAQDVVEEILAAGGRAVADGGSVADWDACGATVARAVDEFGRLDIVVNNAGVTRDHTLTSTSEDDVDITFGVHLKGMFAMSHHACVHWRGLAKKGGAVSGRIVNTTSGAGLYGNVGQTAYATAKAGVVGFTQSLALEAARYGVTVNAISPLALTRMTDGVFGGDRPDGSLDPANSSGLVAYLGSVEAGWLTGQVLRVEGNTLIAMNGWTAGERHVSRDGGPLQIDELVDVVPRMFGVAPWGVGGMSRR